jgi:hypothetical protein
MILKRIKATKSYVHISSCITETHSEHFVKICQENRNINVKVQQGP